MATKHPVIRFHFILAIVLAILGTIFFWWLFQGRYDFRHFLVCWLITVNILTFCYYGYDKVRARGKNSRIPEVLLHSLAIAGGSPAAFIAMRVFRHKTVKGKFQIFFWCIVVLQTVLVLWLIKQWIWN